MLFNNIRLPKFLGWLLPGLKIKRWVFMVFCGVTLIILGTAIMFELHPVAKFLDIIKAFSNHTSASMRGLMVLLFGGVMVFMGLRKTNLSILDALSPTDREKLLETIYRKRKLDKGPKIVAIGGGTGLSSILRGLKHVTNNITGVVTVGDDGGSSGRLRAEMGMIPPGDIRNCIAALADEEDLVTELFQYRFKEGNGLEGHSFGNLFLSALCSITGDMVSAVKESSKVLSIRGRVLPSTLDDMKLVAEMEDGTTIKGESNIPKAQGKIKKLSVESPNLRALEDVIEAIEEADIIVFAPGSLYTSVIPNVLIKEIATTIAQSLAKKVYICNVMTQPGETDDYKVSDHVNAIIDHAGYANIIDTVFVNDRVPLGAVLRYSRDNSKEVQLDKENLKGFNIVQKSIIDNAKDGVVRHSPRKLARLLLFWYKKTLKEEASRVNDVA